MPLILTSQIRSIRSKDEEPSIYLWVPKDIFTNAYSLNDGDLVQGFIENVGIWESYLRETTTRIDFEDFSSIAKSLQETKLEMLFVSSNIGTYDYLFLRSEWKKIRDYGIVPNYNFVRVRIESVIKGSDTIPVFPYRDVKIVVD